MKNTKKKYLTYEIQINNQMLFFVIHVNMRVASIAEKITHVKMICTVSVWTIYKTRIHLKCVYNHMKRFIVDNNYEIHFN